MIDPSKFDIILTQPLLTDEGFANEACARELEAALRDMPETHERLAGNPEWNLKGWVFLHQIVGLVIYWSIRNIDYTHERPIMPNVEQVATWLHLQLRPAFDENQMARLSLCEINKMLHDALDDLTVFREWSDPSIVGESWIDLSAIMHNVCLSIRGERRLDAAFDAKFEAEHGPLTEPGEDDSHE